MAFLNAVIDLSHHNANPDFAAANADGIVGVIHKATQGTQFSDPQYLNRRQAALGEGLLWGAYHFGAGGDGSAQADRFLSIVKPSPANLLVLDLENNPAGDTMSIDEAEAFVQHLFDVTGAWPGLYSGNYIKESLPAFYAGVLLHCWLWLPQYGPTPALPAAWKDWTLWQYTDGTVGDEPHEVKGIGPCDRNMFNGDAEALKLLWHAAP